MPVARHARPLLSPLPARRCKRVRLAAGLFFGPPIGLFFGLSIGLLIGLAAALAPGAAMAAAPARKPVPRPIAEVPMRLPANVEPLGYDLHLTVDPDQPRHSGEVAIDLKLHRPLPANGSLRLHAKDLQLGEVWLEVGARRWPGKVLRVDDERVDLQFKPALPSGLARLVIEFAGALGDKDVYGLFRQQEAGQWMAATQFEATGARQAFPLFDEPGWKVPWRLTLTVPQAMMALSNMPAAQEAPAKAGHKRVQFEATPPLPSYLLAFAVGRFDVRDGGLIGRDKALPHRVITTPGRGAETAFALQTTGAVLQRLEAWFDMAMPYTKLDQLALPVSKGFDAMEHPGLITWGSTSLLARPGEQTPEFERGLVSIAAHELAHQWFGNLVTPAWWDDLWLNESFASWLGDKISAEVQPDWGWQTSTQRARAAAMRADRLTSARRIEEPIRTDDDLGRLWDPITYQKGQTVLAMFEAWLGPERFQAGVRRFIQRHAWGTATGDDFFRALAEQDAGLPSAVRSFTRQAGIPLLDVRLRCDDGPPRLDLQQSRLLPLGSNLGPGEPRWQLPLLVRTPAGTSRLLMTAAAARLPLPDTECPAWVQANASGAGYYRTAYAGLGLQGLVNAPGLSTGDWLVLLDDLRGLHEAGLAGNPQALALVGAGAAHASPEVQRGAAELLAWLQPLVADERGMAHAATWQAAFGARARALGWAARPGEPHDLKLLRTTLLPLVATRGQDVALRDEAQRLTLAWLADRRAAGADVRGPILNTAAATSPDEAAPALFDALLTALRDSSQRPERRVLLSALGHFRQPALAQRARELLLAPWLDIRESLDALLLAQTADPGARAGALDFIANQQAAVVQRLGREEVAGLPRFFRGACSADEARRLEAAFAPQAARYPGGQASLQRTLESVRLCTAWRAQQAIGL